MIPAASPLRWLGGGALLLATLGSPPAGADEMAEKRAAEIGLQPGSTLNAGNASLAEGLLPPEILAYYKSGEWANKIDGWPEGKMIHEKEFDEGTRQNALNLDVDEIGGIIDRRTGKQPPRIIGFPFPNIDPSDPR
ncbi:MAG: hypothetical protein ACREQ9_23515, partial [Candidatus Binatia bacterium]